MKKIASWWKNLEPKKRTYILIGGVVAVVAVYFIVFGLVTTRQMAQLSERLAGAVSYEGKTYIQNPDMRVILCMGIDTSDELVDEGEFAGQYGQADVILVAGIDGKRGRMRLLNIPRDTLVYMKVKTFDGSFERMEDAQLCLQYAYGNSREECATLMEDMISDQILQGLQFDNYAAINFDAIPIIVDDIGGVTVTMEEDLSKAAFKKGKKSHYASKYGIAYKKGETVTLTGKKALKYIRWRNWEDEEYSNLNRIARQKNFMKSFLHDAKAAVSKDPKLVTTIYHDLSDNLNTDLSFADVTGLATDVLGTDFSMEDDFSILEGEATHGVSGLDGSERTQYIIDKDAAIQTMLENFFVEIDTSTGEIIEEAK